MMDTVPCELIKKFGCVQVHLANTGSCAELVKGVLLMQQQLLYDLRYCLTILLWTLLRRGIRFGIHRTAGANEYMVYSSHMQSLCRYR